MSVVGFFLSLKVSPHSGPGTLWTSHRTYLKWRCYSLIFKALACELMPGPAVILTRGRRSSKVVMFGSGSSGQSKSIET